MEKRIELEMRGKPAGEITQLTLDNCRSTQVVGFSDEFTKLEALTLINVGLTTLKGFPKFPALKKLELSDNRLSSGLENLAGCPNLASLNLSGNKFKDMSTLEPLKSMTHLRSLDLFNCEVTNTETYRQKVFQLLPQLQFLDGFDAEDREQEVSDNEGGAGDDDEDEEDDADFDEEGDEDEEGDDEEVSNDEGEEVSEGSDDFDSEGEEEDDEDEDVQVINNGIHKEQPQTEEQSTRGKKRKHEGDEDDEDN